MVKWVDKLSKLLIVNSSRRYLDDFMNKAASSIPRDSWVLDAGAGDCLYKDKFHHTHYESADFCQVNKPYGGITHICDLSNLPVEDNRYDLVVMTQVLEHLAEPTRVLKEIYRVLKPDGSLWLSAPLYYEEHEIPYDFYRYTQFGLRFLLKSAGFKIREMDWLEGYCGTVSHQLKAAVKYLPLRSKDYGGGAIGILAIILMLVIKPLLLFFSLLFSRLDLRYKYTRSGQCKNYCLVATKEL